MGEPERSAGIDSKDLSFLKYFTWRMDDRKSDVKGELAAAAAAAFSSCAAFRLAINLAVDDVGYEEKSLYYVSIMI